MTRATEIFAGILFALLVTVEFGGNFLLRILSGRLPDITDPKQIALFRAGHAHAGVLVLLGLVAYRYVDQARLGDTTKTVVRVCMLAVPLLVSGGFFGGAAAMAGGSPGPLIVLTYVGAIALAMGLSTLAFGLIR
jgi:hypothetical protein